MGIEHDTPNPFTDTPTDDLMTGIEAGGAEIAALRAQLDAATDRQLQRYLVLEERGVSYRAMAKVVGVSNVAIGQLLKRHHERVNPTAKV